MKLILAILCLAQLLTAHAIVPSKFTRQSDDWFKTDEGRAIADNVLTWQSPRGSWPKNGDTASKPFSGKPEDIRGTFDNGATISELRFLARCARLTKTPRHTQAFLKGFDHILEAQYPTGGWPQFYPPGRGYHRHITFNDNSMVRILELLREIAESPDYNFVGEARRAAAKRAFDKGIQCILSAQIIVDGKRTVWCAQHDEITLRPRSARAYELESLSGAESAGILKLLMTLPNPSPEIRRSIQAGVDWYESAKLTGIRFAEINGDRVIVQDPAAPPLWARFHEIETNRPFFCGRDGVKKYELSEIERERRNGYGWYGAWGKDLPKIHAAWKKANP